MAEASTHDHGPVIASSNRYLDIEPYCGRIYSTEYAIWRDVLPWEFPQNASKGIEEAFLKHYFTEREIYIQGGEPGGYRFLKQIWYTIALWNYQIKIPKVADAWMLGNETIINDAALRGHLLSPEAEVPAFFSPQEIDTYGAKLLGQVIGLIQYRVMQLTADDHPWRAASGSGNTNDSTSPPGPAASLHHLPPNYSDAAISDTPSESSSISRSARMQKAGLAIADRPVISLSPVPEDMQRPRAESTTQPQLQAVQVRKRGNSFSRVQQTITRSGQFQPRPQQQHQYANMHYPQQPPHFSSAGPTIGNVPPYMVQQQVPVPSSEYAHARAIGHNMSQGTSALPGSTAPPHIVQQTGPPIDFVSGVPPPAGYLPPHGQPREFRSFSNEQYAAYRHDEGHFPAQGSMDESRITNRHEDSRRDSYSARGGKHRTFSNSRGRPFGGRNSFSGGRSNSEAFQQGSGDARYAPTFAPEHRRRRNSNFSGDWRASAQGQQRQFDENLPPSQEIPSYERQMQSVKHNTTGPPPYTSTSGFPTNPAQQEFGGPGSQGQGYAKHRTQHGYTPSGIIRTTRYTIAPADTHITNLLIFDVPRHLTEADVYRYFETVGPVTSVSENSKSVDRKMWITFGDHQTTVRALALNGTIWLANQPLHIQVLKEYWDRSHTRFPGHGHPDYKGHYSFSGSKDTHRQHAALPSQMTYSSQDARYVKDVLKDHKPPAKDERAASLPQDVLSGSTTPNASGQSTPKKKSKPKKNKSREPGGDLPDSAAKAKAASEAVVIAEHISTVKKGNSDETMHQPDGSTAQTLAAKDGVPTQTSSALSGFTERSESEASPAMQLPNSPSTSSVIFPKISTESHNADETPQQPFRAQTSAEAKTTISGSALTELARSTTAIALGSRQEAAGTSPDADGGRDADVTTDLSKITAPITALAPTSTPASAQKYEDDGVDESFHTAIESNDTSKQQKGVKQPSKLESSTTELTHTTGEDHSLLSVKGRREDRGTDETTSSAVTAITTIHTLMEPSVEPVVVDTEQIEGPSAENVLAASPKSQTIATQSRSPPSAAGSKKVPIPLLVINKATSAHPDDDASIKADDLPTPNSGTSLTPASPTTPTTTTESPMQQSRKSSIAGMPLPAAQTSKVEKSKGPAKTESLSMFAKKQQTSKPKKAKPQKGKGSMKGRSIFDNDGASSTPSPSGSRAASVAAEASPQDVLDQDVSGGDRASIDTVMESADAQSAGSLANSTLQSAQGVGGIPRQRPELQSRKQTDTVSEANELDKNASAASSSRQSSNKSPGSKSDPKQSRCADSTKDAASSAEGHPSSSGGAAPAATTSSGSATPTLFRALRESDTAPGVRDSGSSGGAIPDQTGGSGTGLDPGVPDVGMTDDETAPADEVLGEEKPKKKSRKSGNKKKKGKANANDDQQDSRAPGGQNAAQLGTSAAANATATPAQPSTTDPPLIILDKPPNFMFNFGEDKKTPVTPSFNQATKGLSTAEASTSSPTAVSASSSMTFGRPSDTSGDNTPSSTAAGSSTADSPSSSRVQALMRQQQVLKGKSGLVTAAPNRNMMAKRQQRHKKRSSDSSSSDREGKTKDQEEGEGDGESNTATSGSENATSGRRLSVNRTYILRSNGLTGIGALDSVFDAMRLVRGEGGPGTLLIYNPLDGQDEDANGEVGNENGWTDVVEDVEEEKDPVKKVKKRGM